MYTKEALIAGLLLIFLFCASAQESVDDESSEDFITALFDLVPGLVSEKSGNLVTGMFAGGSGTSSNPYQISTCQELQDMQNDLNAHYELVNDVDCSDTINWNSGKGFKPIGSFDNGFNGHLDGNGHVIQDLYIDRTKKGGMALIRRLNNGGTIKDVGADVDITGNFTVAGLIGYNYGTLRSSYTTGYVSSYTGDFSDGSNPTGDQIGGLVGRNWENADAIINSYSLANVYGASMVGGIVGWNYNSALENVYFAGDASVGNTYADPQGISGGYSNIGGSDWYWQSSSAFQADYGGEELTQSQMQGESACSNMDFDYGNAWTPQNSDYPELLSFTSKGSLECNTPPSASFSSGSPVSTNEDFGLDASGSSDPDGDGLTYEWDTDGDGSYDDATGVSPGVSKSDDGSYSIGLRVSDGNSGSDTTSGTVNVDNRDPSTGFSVSKSDKVLDVDASGSSDLDGTIQSYEWDWTSDGNYEGSGVTATHSYSSGGSYTVKLRLTDNDGATSTETTTVDINNNPVASITANSPVLTSEDFGLDASASSDPDGDSLGYEWDLDNDGSYDDATGVTPSKSESDDGSYSVGLKVSDGNGGADTTSDTVNVDNRDPSSSFSASSTSVLTDEKVDLNDGSSDQDGSISSYNWDFGDSTTSTTRNPSHSFSDDGTYTISLTVTDDDESTDTYSLEITVNNRIPSASFTFNPSNPGIEDSISFDGSGSSDSDGSITGYEWDWDNDGSYEGAGSNPDYSFSDQGDYVVRLRATDNDGATSTFSDTVTVGDRTSPSISNPSPTSNTGRSPDISADFSDNNQLKNYSLYLDGSLVDSGSLSGSSGLASYSSTSLSSGQHSYNWKLSDTSNNTVSRQETFTVNVLNSQGNFNTLNGALWVQGSDLHWGNGTHEFWLKDAQVVNSDSSGPSGALWIQGTKIHWIDQNSDERSYEGSEVASDVGGPYGALWVQNDYIHYIDQEGDERIMNGN